MSRKARVLAGASMFVSACAVIVGLSGSGVAAAAARPIPTTGLRLVPVSNLIFTGRQARPAVASTAYQIRNSDGQCLDADSNHWGSNGDNVQLWSCNANGEQIWYVSSPRIRNSDGQCLDADSNHWGSNGDNVQLWSCNTNGEQEWFGSAKYPYAIVNDDGQCLDADSNHWGSNGDNVQLWSCNTNGEQEWGFAS